MGARRITIMVLVALLPATATALLLGAWVTNQRSGAAARLLVALAILVPLVLAAAGMAAQRLTRPLIHLSRATHRFGQGNLTERVPEAQHPEVRDLFRAFNVMAASLDEADASRRRMTSDVAHELRTSLTNVRGYIEAAQDGVAPLDAALIDSIHEDTLVLQGLVDDLQQLSVADAGALQLDRRPTDLDELARSVTAVHRARAAAAGLELTAELHAGVVADIDPRRIRQVVTNLLDNAIRNTDRGGSVTVSTGLTPDGAEIAVSDDGCGIAADELPLIFERFHRGTRGDDRASGSAGLGLAIARQLIRAHGGRIGVRSAVGHGSTFIVRLPVNQRPLGPLAAALVTSGVGPPPPPSEQERITRVAALATNGHRADAPSPQRQTVPAMLPSTTHEHFAEAIAISDVDESHDNGIRRGSRRPPQRHASGERPAKPSEGRGGTTTSASGGHGRPVDFTYIDVC
jgi:signal transduction histidine kinase